MSQRRAVITGLGVVCSLGRSLDEFWKSLCRGTPAIGPITVLDTSGLRFHNGAEVASYRSEDYFPPERLQLLDRFCEFGLIAADEAVRMSGLQWDEQLKIHSAVVTGTAYGGQTTEDQAFADLYLHKKTRINPLNIPKVMANALASQISMRYGISGPVFTLSTACSSANHAIGHAFWMVRNGLADAALAGGSEAPFSFANLKAWESMRVVSPETCRPFSANRNGLILGEGGGILLIEEREHALARGAAILGEIVGFGMSSDAFHITQPAALGAGRAIQAALQDAGIEPARVGYINAHGTGTPANDPMETSAIRNVFGNHADSLAISSTKSLHGHILGAAGAVEAVATVLALKNGILPPTANYSIPDPACNLDYIPNQSREAACEYALSNSFAFGGLNAVLAFRRPE
jgi:nodulation protein E